MFGSLHELLALQLVQRSFLKCIDAWNLQDRADAGHEFEPLPDDRAVRTEAGRGAKNLRDASTSADPAPPQKAGPSVRTNRRQRSPLGHPGVGNEIETILPDKRAQEVQELLGSPALMPYDCNDSRIGLIDQPQPHFDPFLELLRQILPSGQGEDHEIRRGCSTGGPIPQFRNSKHLNTPNPVAKFPAVTQIGCEFVNEPFSLFPGLDIIIDHRYAKCRPSPVIRPMS